MVTFYNYTLDELRENLEKLQKEGRAALRFPHGLLCLALEIENMKKNQKKGVIR